MRRWVRLCCILGDVTSHRDTSEETAAGPVDGLLTRRDAIRRLALVAVTAAPTTLIAACSGSRNWPGRRRRRRR
jgi:hypothetical protein